MCENVDERLQRGERGTVRTPLTFSTSAPLAFMTHTFEPLGMYSREKRPVPPMGLGLISSAKRKGMAMREVGVVVGRGALGRRLQFTC